MGKNASKNFVNQFKNTRRQAGRRPLVGQTRLEQKKSVKNPARYLKKPLQKNSNRGDK
jgi:hypothetical protein